jgi:hypothetical protein
MSAMFLGLEVPRPHARGVFSVVSRLRSRPSWLLVALVVLGFQGLVIGAYFARGESAVDFARVAPKFVDYSHKSSVIVPSRFGFTRKSVGRGQDELGYDGQFYLFMALDPTNARYYLDAPAYRFQRPLYPAVSRLVAVGDPSLIPIAMLLVNWLAAGAGTMFVALLLVQRRRSAWYALLYGLAPGLTLGVHRDLTEPLGFALCVAGVWCLARKDRHSHLAAGLLFGLAGLARQTSLVFPVAYGLARARTDWRAGGRPASVRAATILLLGLLPYVAWAIFVRLWLGSWLSGAQTSFRLVPFEFMFDQPWAWSQQPIEFIAVVLPTILWIGVAIVLRRDMTAELACALISAAAFVVFEPNYSGYPASGRAVLAVSVPMLVALPQVMRASRWVRTAYLAGFVALMVALPAVVAVDFFNIAGPGH